MLARLALANHRHLALRLQARPAPADVNQNEDCLGQPLMKKHRDQRLIVGMTLPHRVIKVSQTEAQRISTCMDMGIRQSLT